MELAVTLRNMGPQSTPGIMRTATIEAEALGFESIWITDHIAIPPDDSEGSDGRYTDPLTTLAWLAGATTRIRLGVGVLVAPYRPPLPTAKAIATLQELSANRLLLGIGVGWMNAEFRAVGVDRSERGRRTDALLDFLNRGFASDVVTENGQDFLFRPRPSPPPVYIGGRAPHALKRAVRFGHGWMPMARAPDSLASDLDTFRNIALLAGNEPGPVTAMTGLPLDNPDEVRSQLDAWQALGIERLVCAIRYQTLDDYVDRLHKLAPLIENK